MRGILALCLSLLALDAAAASELFRAITENNLQSVREIVDQHPNRLNSPLPNSYTPLLLAADRNSYDIVEYLLSEGARVDDVLNLHYGYTALIYAIKNDNLGMVKKLLEKGADLRYTTNQGESYLHFAAAHNRGAVAAFLLDSGMSVDVLKKGDLTPLHIAAIFGRVEVARILLSHGANLEARSADLGTPLHFAMAAGNAELGELLRKVGARDTPRPFPDYRGRHLGQKIPGTTPELFAPEIFLDIYRAYSAPVFTPDGREVFWISSIMPGIRENRIWWMREENGRWKAPEVAPFSDAHCFNPAVSHDGRKIIFAAWKPVGGAASADSDLWYAQMENGAWSEPRHLGFPPNRAGVYENSPVLAHDGALYFSAFGRDVGGTGVFVAQSIDGGYGESRVLEEDPSSRAGDNRQGLETLIFHSPERKRTGTELFARFRTKTGPWTEAVYLGDRIHGGQASSNGLLTRDEKSLFFIRDLALFWIDASFVHDLREQTLSEPEPRG